MSDFITIRHPDIADSARTTREDFDLNLKAKGWKIVADEDEAAKPTTKTTKG